MLEPNVSDLKVHATSEYHYRPQSLMVQVIGGGRGPGPAAATGLPNLPVSIHYELLKKYGVQGDSVALPQSWLQSLLKIGPG